MKPVNKSTQPSPSLHHCNNDLVVTHIATSTNSLKKGFPPPICHKLVGFGAIVVSAKQEGVELLTQADVDGEKHLLKTLTNYMKGREVANFIPFNFTLPILRGAAYRTGSKFQVNEENWYDVGAWFGGKGNTSMSDCAVAIGLGPRHVLDVALALKDGCLSDVEDQLLIDAFMTLCMRLRQRLVEDPNYDVEMYRRVVGDVRKKVRAVVKEPECKKYVSWKGMTDKKLFLLK